MLCQSQWESLRREVSPPWWKRRRNGQSARVTLVGYEKIGSGRVSVIIRGDVSEVQTSIAAGMASVMRVHGGELVSTYIVAHPLENLEYVLPIRYTREVEQFAY